MKRRIILGGLLMAGALSIAAVELANLRSKRVCCVVSGGNVDEDVYAAVLRREL